MKKNFLVLIILLLIVLILSSIYLFYLVHNRCNHLKKLLDESIIDTNNPPGRFVISVSDQIVGGMLVNISSPGYYFSEDINQSKVTYILTFKGLNKQGDLFLRTFDAPLHYRIGNFYQFDLSNIQMKGMLSGAFLDPNQTQLNLINCN